MAKVPGATPPAALTFSPFNLYMNIQSRRALGIPLSPVSPGLVHSRNGQQKGNPVVLPSERLKTLDGYHSSPKDNCFSVLFCFVLFKSNPSSTDKALYYLEEERDEGKKKRGGENQDSGIFLRLHLARNC